MFTCQGFTALVIKQSYIIILIFICCFVTFLSASVLSTTFSFSVALDTLISSVLYNISDRLCGLVFSVADYRHRGPGFDSRALLTIFLRELGLERGPLSLVIG
jgi:hypothetical protein